MPASFTATTANAIGFNRGWFNVNVIGSQDYAALVGTPSIFAFATKQPGAIANFGNLSVSQGNLTLLGGTVVSTGSLSAPGGQVTVASVPGESVVRISQSGNLLALEIQDSAFTPTSNSPLPTPLSLPQLLTGGNVGNAQGLLVGSDGTVQLTGSGIQVENGDVVASSVQAQTATLSAQRYLTLPESQLFTTRDLNLLAQDTVLVRDSVANPVLIQAGGSLYIQGNKGIDILALNHPQTPFVSGGNLSLVSDGIISGDAHFASGGNFLIRSLSGGRVNFTSLYDPIISAMGDVDFSSADYTGAALKVEATGSIKAGNITITSNDTTLAAFCVPASKCSPDANILASEPALILRAGLPSLQEINYGYPPQVTGIGGTVFKPGGGVTPVGSISVGNISTSSTTGNGGSVILSATGNINSGAIGTLSLYNGGSISLSAVGDITTKQVISGIDDGGSGNAGNITVNAGGNINTADVQAAIYSISLTYEVHFIPLSCLHRRREKNLLHFTSMRIAIYQC